MLLQLTPAECARDWVILKKAFQIAAPPFTTVDESSERELMDSLLTDKLQAWYSAGIEEGQPIVYAVVLTSFQVDGHSGITNLLIYSLYGLRSIPEEEWLECFQTLKRYGISKGVRALIAYSKVPRVIAMCERLGANSEERLIQWQLDSTLIGD